MKVDIKIKHISELLEYYDPNTFIISTVTDKNGYQEIPDRVANKCYFNCKKYNDGYDILVDQGYFNTQIFVHEIFVEREINKEDWSMYYV